MHPPKKLLLRPLPLRRNRSRPKDCRPIPCLHLSRLNRTAPWSPPFQNLCGHPFWPPAP
jgi:hypothetical protein